MTTLKQRIVARLNRWRDFTWTGPSAGWIVIWAVVLILGLSALLAAGAVGFSRGLADRRIEQAAEIASHYQKGLDHLAAGRMELATAEFEMVLRLDPSNTDALRQLNTLQQMPAPAATPTVLPPLSPPPIQEAAPRPLDLTQDVILAQAKVAIQNQQWLTATVLLDELSILDPNYRTEEVTDLRFAAANQYGLALAGEDRFEEAISAFDTALELQPDAAELQTQRDLLALYSNALANWGDNWPGVVTNLEAINQIEPGYRDVTERLAEAEAAWADELMEDQRWCQAEERYKASLAWQPSAAIRSKNQEAAGLCANPPDTATPDVETAVEPESTLEPKGDAPASDSTTTSGALLFASYSEEFARWTIYRQALGSSGPPKPLTEGASQPALSPSGNRLAVRSQRGDQTGLLVLSSVGNDLRRLTTFAEDGHPSWSPDGQLIAFDSNREGDRRWRIYRNWSGGGEASSLGYGRWPAWSPLNDAIAYQGCDERGNRCGLWLMGTDGNNPRPLTLKPGDAMPAWSPDGSQIAFASAERDGSWNVYLVEVASGQVRRLAASAGVDAHPAWSPAGRQVAFLSSRSGDWAIYAVDVATGQTRHVATIPDSVPDWFEEQIDWTQ